MSEHQTCLICTSSQLVPLEEYKKHHLVKCQKCSFVFAKKIPGQKELENQYEGYGRNDYLSPVTVKRYEELLDHFEKYRKNNRLLDVGCGIGYFLVEAKKRGWEVFGTEYTSEAMKICAEKGIKMNKGELNPGSYEQGKFDIITSFEVIEHICNPKEEISKIHQLLRTGGLVYITTPNFNSLLRYFFKSGYDVISYPEHLSYYTCKTLMKLLKNNDFDVLSVQTTGLSISRAMAGLKIKTIQPIAENSHDEKLRISAEQKIFFKVGKIFLNYLLDMIKKGDAIKIYAVKKQSA